MQTNYLHEKEICYLNCIILVFAYKTKYLVKGFIMIKKKLCSARGLASLNFDKLFEVECDASIVGIGGVQSEEGRPIAFFREKLSVARKKWTTYELEFYAVVQALQTWEHYLIQRKFILYTDHQALKIRYAVCVDGIKVDEKKVRAIEVCFHGLTPFYGRFIRNFSSIMSPVTTCMEKGQFKWTNEASKSFIMIKKKLCSAHGLAFLNFDKLFEAECDASIVGIGGVQSEEGRPIAFFRGKLSEVRKKWTTYELEFYDVVQASQTWEHYLIQRKFIFYTDHQALKISKYQTFIDRMHASWSSFIQRFTFVMKHRKTACLLNLRAEITRFDYLKELYLNDDDFSQHNI
ncbi:unnamed protein product [Spirodela intermedia]|uniref:Reverse transcriptase RNase H-like domain-containing protein n=1 Tax=Spirodela intermedia TaxID=51605 RepID=A0ABN7EAN7_SPIIN|nr:unnamed protein product [Spirodela intermedia]